MSLPKATLVVALVTWIASASVNAQLAKQLLQQQCTAQVSASWCDTAFGTIQVCVWTGTNCIFPEYQGNFEDNYQYHK